MILVVGATGRLGKAVSILLLKEGKRVRAGNRTPSKAEDLRTLGAELVRIDLRDRSTFRQALQGATAVFTAAHGLTARAGDSIERVDVTGHEALIDAAVDAGVQHFVYTSAQGAHPNHPAAFMRGKADVENYLASSGLDYIIIRPSAFMELYAGEMIGARVLGEKRVIILGNGDLRRNLVAVDDVARAVGMALAGVFESPNTLEICGPDNVTEREVAALYGRLSGRAVRIMAIPASLLPILARVARPLHAGVSNLLLFNAQNERHGGLTCDAADTATLLGRMPAGVEAFVRAHVAAYKA